MDAAQFRNHPAKSRVPVWGALLLLALASVGWGGHHRTKARCSCGIPGEYAYDAVRTTGPKREVSATGFMLRNNAPRATAADVPGASPTIAIVPEGAGQPALRVDFFQLERTQVAIDHCAISRVALMLQQDGRWRLSLQADQNPKSTAGTSVPTGTVTTGRSQLQTSHLRRNQFHIVVQGFGFASLKENADVPNLGKPLLFRFEMEPFWVQSGVPQDMVWDGNSRDVQQYFQLVDRVEVSFSYR